MFAIKHFQWCRCSLGKGVRPRWATQSGSCCGTIMTWSQVCVCCFQVVEMNWNWSLSQIRSYLSKAESVFTFFRLICGSDNSVCLLMAALLDPPSLLTQEGCLPTTSPPMMTHTELNSLLFITVRTNLPGSSFHSS